MGVRIVVVFQYDLAHIWSKDPMLGNRILSHVAGIKDYPGAEIEGGKVVEVLDDSVQSLLMFDRYDVHRLAYEAFAPRKTIATCLLLLRNAARNLGYTLIRNPFWKRRGNI